MMEYAARTTAIPIPCHKLLQGVALVDADNRETRALLDRLVAERFEVEISDGTAATCSRTCVVRE